MNQLKKQQSGFTLVEIAIVLVIIGLLLGGVLKGQELINSAKVKNMIGDFRTVSSLVYGYQDRFKAFPGDQNQNQLDDAFGAAWQRPATLPLPACARRTTAASTAPGMPATLTAPVSPRTKASVFWQHVRLANLATGPTALTDTDYRPRNADGGFIGIEMSGTERPSSRRCGARSLSARPAFSAAT
ncbi:MAG: prepilin-type N-terminal cleavage/methylation domain-containing protein [Candidatus Accumulibacter necessarius]|jgi:prepilin-type N-terminal cleavage/methylation domain-containing protein|uniref:prepilin-type N-terminal cleavage/methylation domain-containing protein n=1 Tax=Candidatus Accumulibacter necessarius TaxID=2954386 RepID=UPI002FC39806